MDKKKKIPEKEKMKKIFLQPSRVKDFHCIGSECEDLCCLGKWTVFIDKDSYNFYKSKLDKEEKDIFRKYMKPLKENRSNKQYGYLLFEMRDNLTKSDNPEGNNSCCPMLSDDMRCRMQMKYGEDILCHVCYIYPRLNSIFDGIVHQTLDFTCPEAVRVLLDREEKMEFEYIEKTVRKWQHFEVNFGDDISREMFGENLSQTVDILQERSTSVDDRMVRLGLMYNKMKQVDESEELSLDDKKILSKYWYKYAFSKDISDEIEKLPKTPKLLFNMMAEDILKNINIGSRDIAELYKKDGTNEYSFEVFKETYQKTVKPFFENYSYLIENYLVNIWFETHEMPISDKEYEGLVIRYMTLKFFCVWYAISSGSLNKDEFLAIVQKISKYVVNNSRVIKIKKILEDKKWNDIYHLITLFNF